MSVSLICGIVALVFGIVAVVEARGRNWAGWGVIVLAALVLYGSVK
jgi:hypothetical protein